MCNGYTELQKLLYKIRTTSPKNTCKLMIQKVWLPGMGSNHDYINSLKQDKLVIH